MGILNPVYIVAMFFSGSTIWLLLIVRACALALSGSVSIENRPKFTEWVQIGCENVFVM
jgi:hypothetical protein